MASNKDKLLESAQKNLKKKQVVKAIKDYARVVELDPADVRSRQKLAELYVRTKKNTEAYEQYESVAKYFASNGFNLKAIAIYKQMQRLDPSQISIYNRLAELNEKQGLLGNAMAEYRNLVDYYERNGMVADEIRTLEKMRELDLENLNIRIKLAEVYANNDRRDDGLEELESVLEVLGEKEAFDKILKLYKMFMPLYPDNKKMQMGLALTFYEKGDHSRGVAILDNLLRDKPEDPDLLRLLGQGYMATQDWSEAGRVFQQLLRMDASDLNTRESLIQCKISNEQYDGALSELEEWKDVFLKTNRLDRLRDFYELLKEKLVDSAVVLETLDSIYELTGEGDKLLDIISEKEDEREKTTTEESLSDSLLGSAEADITGSELEPERAVGDDILEFDIVGNEAAGQDEELDDNFIELDIEEHDDLEIDGVPELDMAFDLPEESAGPVVPDIGEALPQRNLQGDLDEADFYIQQGLYDEAEKLLLEVLADTPDSSACREKLEEIEAKRSAAGSGFDFLADPAERDDQFDFDIETPGVDTAGEPDKKVFKTDVDEQIAADDMESHYNLGIAYREMGLFDDAVSEFDKAEKDPSRFVDCLTLKGLCYSDKNDYVSAEKVFMQALDSQYLEDIQRLNLGYELGLLYERADRLNDALISYQNVLSQDSNYRDVSDKIAALEESLSPAGEGEDGLPEDSRRISFL